MHWNENLYRLHQRQGGAFFGTKPAAGLTEDILPNGTLVLPYRDTKLIVRPVYVPTVPRLSDRGFRGNAMWTEVTAEIELKKRRTVTVKPQKGLLSLLRRQRKTGAPAGYQVKTDDEAFALWMLSQSALRGHLRMAREKAPAALPLVLRLTPQDDGVANHLLSVRTNLFPVEWGTLKGVGDGREIVPLEVIEKASIDLLERMVETAKAAYDAAHDAPL